MTTIVTGREELDTNSLKKCYTPIEEECEEAECLGGGASY